MKTYIRYSDIPSDATYLGTENGDGTMYQDLQAALDDAAEPVQLIDEHGVSYFDLAVWQ